VIDVPTGIVIPVDESEPIRRHEINVYSEYQEIIGGYFQVVELDDIAASLYCDEEGKLKSLPMNRRATLLTWLHVPAFRHRDVISGTVILMGQPDDCGNTVSIPQELDDLLMDTLSYKVEVQTVDDADAWNSNAMRYTDWVEAYNAALSLAERWMAVEQVRVVPA